MKKAMAWIKAHKIAAGMLGVVFVIILIATSTSGPAKSSDTSSHTTASSAGSSQQASSSKQPLAKYQLVADETWIKGDSAQSVYLIGSASVNTTEMPDFCKWLSGVAVGQPQYFKAFVYDDQTAAELLKVMQAGTDTSKQDAQYDPHYIISYTKSPQENQCTIQYKGTQDPSPVTLNY